LQICELLDKLLLRSLSINGIITQSLLTKEIRFKKKLTKYLFKHVSLMSF